MYYEYNNIVFGVLNDYDLAIFNEDKRELAKERTGTAPYMAIQLLEAINTNKSVEHKNGRLSYLHARSSDSHCVQSLMLNHLSTC